MSIRVKYDTFTESLIMNNDTSSPSQIIIPNWAMDLITKDYKHEIDRLKLENAKLRELVQDMWFWGYEGHMDNESQEWQMKHIDGVLCRMRELEIEEDA